MQPKNRSSFFLDTLFSVFSFLIVCAGVYLIFSFFLGYLAEGYTLPSWLSFLQMVPRLGFVHSFFVVFFGMVFVVSGIERYQEINDPTKAIPDGVLQNIGLLLLLVSLLIVFGLSFGFMVFNVDYAFVFYFASASLLLYLWALGLDLFYGKVISRESKVSISEDIDTTV